MIKQLTIALLFLPLAIFAQPRHGQDLIDSLVLRLPQLADDTDKVMVLSQISLEYFIIRADKGIKYGTEGLELASRLKWKKGMAMCHLGIGINYAYVPNNPKAFENYIQSLKLYEELDDRNGMSEANVVMGNVHAYYTDYPKAIEYYSKALKLNEELGKKREIARCRTAIGEMSAGKGDVAVALENYLKAIRIFEDIGNKQEAARTTGMAGVIYTGQKNYLTALDYEERAVRMAGESGADYYKALNLNNIALCYLAILHDTSANAQSVMKRLFGSPPHNKIALRQKATSLFHEALMIALKIRSLDVRYTCYQNMIELARANGDYKKALEYIDIFSGIKDTLYSRETENKVSKMAIQNEYSRKHFSDSLRSAEKESAAGMQLQKQRNYTYVSIGGVAILCCISLFVVNERSKSERERKKSTLLADQLKESLQQKDILMKEIHHRVKNNLTMIGTLLDLQADNITDSDARKAITEGIARVKSISLIHQQLYMKDDITSVEFSKFAQELLHQVTSIFKQLHQNIALVNKIPETYFDIDTAVPLGLILNELMTNSYKYGFPDNCDGSITIALEKERGFSVLLYQDSGPGLSENHKVKDNSLGMLVMESLSRQLGGTFEYKREKKQFIVTFKEFSERKKIA